MNRFRKENCFLTYCERNQTFCVNTVCHRRSRFESVQRIIEKRSVEVSGKV